MEKLERRARIGAQILHELGLRRILLLTNHPPKISAIEGFELEVVGNVPLGSPATDEVAQTSVCDSDAAKVS